MRAFVLVKAPFQNDAEALHWSRRSAQFAFDCGATAVSLIPTRFGGGTLETLAQSGQFSPPSLDLLELALEEAVALQRGRIFADLWDLEKFSRCSNCFPQRLDRLRRMNLQQRIEPRVACKMCGQSGQRLEVISAHAR